MNIRSLTTSPYVLPDSTTAKSSSVNIMGKSFNLFDVKTVNDPFTDFLMNGEALSEISSHSTDVTSSSHPEKEVNEDITLLRSSEPFIIQEQEQSTPLPPSLILNPQHETSTSPINNTIYSNINPNSAAILGEIYTLTLGDGTAVQLRVQTCDTELSEPITIPDVSSTSGLPPPPTSHVPSDTSSMVESISTIVSQSEGVPMDWSESLNDLPTQNEFPLAFQNLLARDELIIRKMDNQLTEEPSSLLSRYNITRLSTDVSTTSSSISDDDESLNSVKLSNWKSAITKDGHVNLELLKNELNTLPDGQLNLEAILQSADVPMTVEEIVKPTLTSLKKIMSQKGFSDWQMALCLKIRRRKKNTAAVRSSRRKRVHYVYQLKEHVSQLSKRRKEAELENSLLKQLKFLWERLVQEVELEVQEGKARKVGCSSTALSTNPPLSVS
ncbi:uncharacterized protein [Lepeophtheirus salmonis]|uniref:uncharacterized protein n=1 Tax=Lepeophtheirus salmonis TaxID=72036 RepID=UPI001AE21E79|nr:uncharacterized protein LOC121124601 [Lepeophtheirus salmonis]